MGNSFTKFIPALLLLSFVIFSSPALAENSLPKEEKTPLFEDQEWPSTDDLSETNLAKESSPTTDRFLYWWERVSFNIKTIFTFNAEKKAALYQSRLSSLDKKAAACAVTGDKKCLDIIGRHTNKLEERTEKFLTKREELKKRLLEKFDDWSAKRQKNLSTLRDRAVQLRSQNKELGGNKNKYKNTGGDQNSQDNQQGQQKKNARERLEVHEDNDGLNLHLEQRVQNREEIIEKRSFNLKQQLDSTRAKIEMRYDETP